MKVNFKNTFPIVVFLLFVTGISAPVITKAAEGNKDYSDPAALVPTVHRPLPEVWTDSFRAWQGISSIEVTSNDRVWITWYSGGLTEAEDNYVLLITSGDGGETWSQPIFAVDHEGPIRLFDPALWRDPTGRLWLFWAQGEVTYENSWLWTWDGRQGVWAMTTDNPEAGENAVWSAPRRLCNGVMMNKPIVNSQGQWLFPASVWQMGPSKYKLPDEEYGANVYLSTDEGKTLTLLGSCNGEKLTHFAHEHCLIERKDKSLWLLSRIESGGGIGESVSIDGGKTWPELNRTAYKQSSSRTFMRRLNSGNLLFLKNGPVEGVNGKDVGRSQLMAFLSEDDGKTWVGGLMLDSRNNVSYPDAGQSEDGTIFATWDYDRYGSGEILFARFTEDDIKAGKIDSRRGKSCSVANSLKNQKMFIVPQEKNLQGTPLITGEQPEIKYPQEKDRYDLKKLEPGALLYKHGFSSRCKNIPPQLVGKNYLQGYRGQGLKFEVEKDGVVYILSPSPHYSPYSQEETLFKQGFSRVDIPEFLLFCNSPDYIVRVYQKEVKKGEKYEYSMWGILIF
ncbi:MAG: sialidase family protein [Planctomycetia bacterium]|nr:sialidase family protein [Planctomycetia bacterium]